MAEEFALRVWPTVGERALCELPDAFLGVEFRGITREAVKVEPGKAVLERANCLAGMDRAVVPDHDHWAAEMAEQIPEERRTPRGGWMFWGESRK
jgi:hypothetical protein